MPEGPEIRRAADDVAAVIQGKTIEAVYFGLPALKSWEPKLTGQLVLSVDTKGKALLTRFANGLSIYSHNQLYGRWIIRNQGERPDTKRQLRLALHTAEQSALLYSASTIAVLDEQGIKTHPFLSKLGPDVLDSRVSWSQIAARLTSPSFRNRGLGNFLTDQSFVAGLGNYLRCEILFISGLHPKTRPIDLEDIQLNQLAENILSMPRQSYQTAGITQNLAHANKAIKQGDTFESARFWVFRRAGLPCRICGSEVQRVSQGGQACYICPQCQGV